MVENRHFMNNGIDIEVDLIDFLKWSCGALWDGSDKGVLSEFIVRTAIGSDSSPADGRQMNLITNSGFSVVTSAASFLQSTDAEPDHICFSCIPRKNRHRHPDAFVFCLFRAYDRTYDPLEMSNWTFYSLAGDRVRSLSKVSLQTLLRMEPVQSDFVGLESAIDMASNQTDTVTH